MGQAGNKAFCVGVPTAARGTAVGISMVDVRCPWGTGPRSLICDVACSLAIRYVLCTVLQLYGYVEARPSVQQLIHTDSGEQSQSRSILPHPHPY